MFCPSEEKWTKPKSIQAQVCWVGLSGRWVWTFCHPYIFLGFFFVGPLGALVALFQTQHCMVAVEPRGCNTERPGLCISSSIFPAAFALCLSSQMDSWGCWWNWSTLWLSSQLTTNSCSNSVMIASASAILLLPLSTESGDFAPR